MPNGSGRVANKIESYKGTPLKETADHRTLTCKDRQIFILSQKKREGEKKRQDESGYYFCFSLLKKKVANGISTRIPSNIACVHMKAPS